MPVNYLSKSGKKITEMSWHEYLHTKKRFFIGIDPDLVKSGVAFWFKDKRKLEVFTLSTTELILKLNEFKKEFDFVVIIEAGWLNKKSNFRMTQNKAIGEAIARKVGENHSSGKIIQQACLELGIEHKLIRPTNSKVNSEYFFKLTGLKIKNQEMIDAGMLVYGM